MKTCAKKLLTNMTLYFFVIFVTIAQHKSYTRINFFNYQRQIRELCYTKNWVLCDRSYYFKLIYCFTVRTIWRVRITQRWCTCPQNWKNFSVFLLVSFYSVQKLPHGITWPFQRKICGTVKRYISKNKYKRSVFSWC